MQLSTECVKIHHMQPSLCSDVLKKERDYKCNNKMYKQSKTEENV